MQKIAIIWCLSHYCNYCFFARKNQRQHFLSGWNIFLFPFYKTFTIWRRFEQIFFFLSNKFVITDSKIDTFYCYSSITPLFIIIDWREKYIKIKNIRKRRWKYIKSTFFDRFLSLLFIYSSSSSICHFGFKLFKESLKYVEEIFHLFLLSFLIGCG